MRWRDLGWGAGAAALLLAGCSTPEPRPHLPASVAAPAVPPQDEAKAPTPLLLADELQRLRTMPGSDLAAETQTLLDAGDPRSRLKGAIALAQPQHPARDEVRGVALAEEIARSTEVAPALRDLAAAVALWLDEQRRAEANGRRAQTKAREDEAKLALAEARLRELERRAQDAEKKLEALRAIERDLSGRGPNGRP